MPEYVRRRAAPRLRGLVSGYSGYRWSGAPGLHHGLPSTHLTLVVCLSGTLDFVGRRPASFVSVAGGLHDGPVVMSHHGLHYGLQLDVPWRGARALLGVPAGELAGGVIGLPDLLGDRADELVERLAAAPTWRHRFRLLDTTLSGLADHGRGEPPAEVAQAWRRLTETAGSLRIGALAREVGWSRRHLTSRFQREIGLPPKAAARVIRFERARRLLRSRSRPSLAETAVECGYADQAHLARDFRALGGLTATQWLAEFPSVQDLDATLGDDGPHAAERQR
ncbi:helix-turn-helix domain-containing protein [Nonomuraea sp. 3-1Str]|uniref:AraC family transcriptional regulator n=1 Tax=Nonomuraea sp. 3-1Str TaxID=2929801 RepID=UPI002858B690|nr:helix-turn-helix domain-containing protein [Nonomuraea sp. 3-1Str]MDR8410561.1 helix-turn-helix domain-containing protein [Nonomuraea sp. 3-1Str]